MQVLNVDSRHDTFSLVFFWFFGSFFVLFRVFSSRLSIPSIQKSYLIELGRWKIWRNWRTWRFEIVVVTITEWGPGERLP